jgi:hypothetical protein
VPGANSDWPSTASSRCCSSGLWGRRDERNRRTGEEDVMLEEEATL